MKLMIFGVFLILVCWPQYEATAQRLSRTPQGHVQYSDPDGSKVMWRLYAPYTQWKSHLEATPQRESRAHDGDAVQPRLTQQVDLPVKSDITDKEMKTAQMLPQQVEYKPFSKVPMHIKQLLMSMYEPEQPYIDPSVYIYQALQQHQQRPEEEQERNEAASNQDESVQASAQSPYSTGLYEHIPRYQTKYEVGKPKLGYIKYRDEQQVSTESEAPRYGTIPVKSDEPVEGNQQPQQQYDGMPPAIQKLLTLQSQMPYHVIADKIVYKPKSIFVPKHFVEDTKGPYKYRSKVYYYKNGGYEPEGKERPDERGDDPREQEEE